MARRDESRPHCPGCDAPAPNPHSPEAKDWQPNCVLHSPDRPELQLTLCPDCAAGEPDRRIDLHERYRRALRDAAASPAQDPAVERSWVQATQFLEQLRAQDKAWRAWGVEREAS